MKGVKEAISKELGDVDTAPAEKKISGGLGGAFKTAAKAGAVALGAISTAGLVAGFGAVIKGAVDASDATNKFQSTLEFAGKSSADIERLTKSTTDYANKTVYGLGDIQNVTSQLAANNVKGYDSLAEAAGNLNAVAGGNAETFKSVGMVLTQTAGAGKLTTENWNQMADAIPGASGKLQEAMLKNGAYTGNFRDAMSEGQITAEEFNQAIMDLGMTDAAKEAATSTKTLEGAWGNLQATLVQGAMGIVDKVKPAITGFLTSVGNGAQTAFDWINSTMIPGIQGVADILFKGEFKGAPFGLTADSGVVTFLNQVHNIGKTIADIIKNDIAPFVADALPKVVGFLGKIANHKGTIQAIGAGFLVWKTAMMGYAAWQLIVSARTKVMAAAQAALNAVMNANPVGLIVLALAALVAGLVYAWNNSETFRNVVTGAWEGIKSAVSAVANWFTATLLPTLSGVWDGVKSSVSTVGGVVANVWNGILSAVSVVVGWFQTYVQPVLSAVWSGIQTGVSFLGSAISLVWNGIKAGVAVVVDWFQTYVQPVLSAVWSVLSFGFTVFKDLVIIAWAVIKVAAAVVVSWFQTYVQPVLSAVASGIGTVFSTLKNTISTVWDGIKTAVSAVADWFSNTLQPKITSVTDGIKSAFTTMKDGIKTVWDSIKSIAAKPVNFLIETVYTDGIKSMADKIADKLGLSLRLPSVSKIEGYATGGQWKTVTPGYTPGRDVFHFFSPDGGGALALSGGEGIIRPDALRALGGKSWLDRVNASRGAGLASVGDVGSVAFAEGGVWDRVKSGVSTAANWVSTAVDAAESIIEDPVGAVANLIRTPVDALMSQIPGSGLMTDMAKALPGKWIDGFSDWLKKKTDSMGSSDLVSAARKAVRMGVPYVWGGSSVPPGLDCSGLVYWAAHQMGSKVARMTAAGYQSTAAGPGSQSTPGNLLFWGNPAHHIAIASGNGRMIEEPHPGLSAREVSIWGAPTAKKYKFDNGGWLQPGLTNVLNETGKPEPVLTSSQWDKLNMGMPSELVIRDVDDVLVGRMRVEAVGRIIENTRING